jgi:DNA gyrase subunit A
MTHFGYIKRMPVSEYKSQKRGGIGITAHKAKEEDFVENLFITNTHDDILFFTNMGKVFSLKGYDIPEAQRAARGRAIINLIQLSPEEKVTAVLPLKEEQSGYLVLATKNGLIKKTSLEEYRSIKRNGKKAITFVDDDELISAVITSGEDELIVASSGGLAIRFAEKNVRPMSRSAQGVIAMNLQKGEYLVDMAVLTPGCEILTVSQNGYGKRSEISDYPLQGRAGKGVRAGVFNERTGKLVGLKVVPPETDIMMIADNGIIIRVDAGEISKFGRDTMGVRIMKLKDEGQVVSIALAPKDEE